MELVDCLYGKALRIRDEYIPLGNASIPHRPGLKTEENVTTKIRIVLNCYLKIKNSPSLNESAYQGINLISYLFELLLKIRNNKYLMMIDIKHVFLSIELKTDENKNEISIF